jgi:2-keto-3-deoxy-L-rhamnonate aldolase RhmA
VPATISRYLDLGVTFAAVGNDAVVLRQGADARLKSFRS